MRIDATRYTKFWSNPERYRLSQQWSLAPVLPKSGMARLFLRGRMRGSAFHELMDGHTPDPSIYNAEEISAAREMADLIRAKYPDEICHLREVQFEYTTPRDNVLVGRIDHIIQREGPVVGDYKTCGQCTKKELEERIRGYLGSAQVPFYLLGAKTLGYECQSFLFRVIQKKQVHERWRTMTALDLEKFVRQVDITCSIIEMLQKEWGIQKSWPTLTEKYTTGFEAIAGKQMYTGYLPEGFERRQEHLSIIEERSEVPDL